MQDLSRLPLNLSGEKPHLVTFNAQAFLGTLNGPDGDEDSSLVAGTVRRHPGPFHFDEEASRGVPDQSPLWPLYGKDEVIPRETTPLAVRLRRWVDAWLSTGRSRRGKEDPRKRKETPEIDVIVTGFTRNKMHYKAVGGLLYPWFDLNHDFDATPEDGPLVPRWDDANDYAAQFVLFLMSPFKYQLAKCVICGTYFALPERQAAYVNGTKCSFCKGRTRAEASMKLTASSRTAAAKTLHSLTAHRFSKDISRDDEWFSDPVLGDRIVTFLNKEISAQHDLRRIYTKGIMRRWLSLTKNHEAISAMVNAAVQH